MPARSDLIQSQCPSDSSHCRSEIHTAALSGERLRRVNLPCFSCPWVDAFCLDMPAHRGIIGAVGFHKTHQLPSTVPFKIQVRPPNLKFCNLIVALLSLDFPICESLVYIPRSAYSMPVLCWAAAECKKAGCSCVVVRHFFHWSFLHQLASRPCISVALKSQRRLPIGG
jgi:hypothetical protein